MIAFCIVRPLLHGLKALGDVPALSPGAGSDAERSHNWLSGKVGKKNVIAIGHYGMRDPGFGAFARSSFKLSEIFAFDGDFGSANTAFLAI